MGAGWSDRDRSLVRCERRVTKHEGIIKVPKTLDINVPGILTLYVAAHNVGRRAATRVGLVQWAANGNFKGETASGSEPRDIGVAGPNLTPTTDASSCLQGSGKRGRQTARPRWYGTLGRRSEG